MREGWGFILKVNLTLQSCICVGYTHVYKKIKINVRFTFTDLYYA